MKDLLGKELAKGDIITFVDPDLTDGLITCKIASFSTISPLIRVVIDATDRIIMIPPHKVIKRTGQAATWYYLNQKKK